MNRLLNVRDLKIFNMFQLIEMIVSLMFIRFSFVFVFFT